jgi:hypothetical protein
MVFETQRTGASFCETESEYKCCLIVPDSKHTEPPLQRPNA